MAGLLGDIFGAADTAKRKLRDVVANPLLSAQQFMGNMNDRARNLNEMTAAAALEGVDYGPASQRLGGLLAEGYGPVGMVSRVAPKSIDELAKKYPDVTFDARVNKNDINLSRIVVPKELRNQGIGTQVMNDLSAFADSIGKRITLTPSSDFGGSVPKLKTFYKEFGFVENKGRNKDFSTMEAMYRDPKMSNQSSQIDLTNEMQKRLNAGLLD
jgi:GNAT superfamily N-acetyltransferase